MTNKEAFEFIKKALPHGIETLQQRIDQLEYVLAEDVMVDLGSVLGLLIKVDQVADDQIATVED